MKDRVVFIHQKMISLPLYLKLIADPTNDNRLRTIVLKVCKHANNMIKYSSERYRWMEGCAVFTQEKEARAHNF